MVPIRAPYELPSPKLWGTLFDDLVRGESTHPVAQREILLNRYICPFDTHFTRGEITIYSHKNNLFALVDEERRHIMKMIRQ